MEDDAEARRRFDLIQDTKTATSCEAAVLQNGARLGKRSPSSLARLRTSL
jgi:hypothetical protein